MDSEVKSGAATTESWQSGGELESMGPYRSTIGSCNISIKTAMIVSSMDFSGTVEP